MVRRSSRRIAPIWPTCCSWEPTIPQKLVHLDNRRLETRDESDDATLDRRKQLYGLDGREHWPLQPAPDAHTVDTTDLALPEVVARIVALVEACR